jgi:hypothetical protein
LSCMMVSLFWSHTARPGFDSCTSCTPDTDTWTLSHQNHTVPPWSTKWRSGIKPLHHRISMQQRLIAC